MVMMDRVSDPATIEVPNCRKSTNSPRPKRPYTTEGMPARLMIASRITRVNQVSRAYSDR